MGKCLSAPTESESSTVLNRQKRGSSDKARPKRSASMQAMWSDNWTEVIEDRSSKRMKSESNLSECAYTFDKCNCVQRVIFVMNIYKFWNDRKHIVKY